MTTTACDASYFGNRRGAERPARRARRQIGLAPRPHPGRARRRPHARRAACSKAMTCCAPPPPCARSAPASRATAGRRLDASTASGWAVSPSRQDVLDLGNSGTGARLLMGLVASHPITAFFTGDASLRRRPMARVTGPLEHIGARIIARDGGRMPLARHRRAPTPLPITYRLPVASAQVKSAVLLAGLNAPGETSVIEPQPTRDHSERMLRHFGAAVDTGRRAGWRPPHHPHRPARAQRRRSRRAGRSVLGRLPDGRGAAAAGLGSGDRGGRRQPAAHAASSTRCARWARDLTSAMSASRPASRSADLDRSRQRRSAASRCRPSARPRMIDEYPILAVAAAFAGGRTVMHGLGELRVKESDRLGRHRPGPRRLRRRGRGRGRHADRRGHGRAAAGRRRGRDPARPPHRHGVPGAGHGGAAAGQRSMTAPPSPPAFPDFVAPMNRLGAAIARREPMIIAIDGPAASGKGTLARRLAAHFGLAHLDTGGLYRAVGAARAGSGGDPADPAAAAEAAAGGPGRRPRRPAAARRGGGAGRLGGRCDSRRCAGAAGLPARLRPPSPGRPARSGAGRARHRHGGLPRGCRQALRHRHPRGAGRHGEPRSCGKPARPLYTRPSCRT